MITAGEIRNQNFKKSLRGFDKEEVHAFLGSLADEWEKFRVADRKTQEELTQMKADYGALKKVEEMLHKTLLQAEQSAKNTMENAHQKAEIKLREAEATCRDIIRQGVDERNRQQHEIDRLSARKDEIVLHLEVFLKSQIERIKEFERNRELPSPSANTYNHVPEQQIIEIPSESLPVENPENLFGMGEKQALDEKDTFDDFADEL